MVQRSQRGLVCVECEAGVSGMLRLVDDENDFHYFMFLGDWIQTVFHIFMAYMTKVCTLLGSVIKPMIAFARTEKTTSDSCI